MSADSDGSTDRTGQPPLISQADGLHSPPKWLRERVVRYVAAVETHPDDPLPFRENPQPGAPADIETTVWALVALRQVGAEAAIERARPRALAALNAAFNPDLGIYEPTSTQIGGGPGTWRMHFDAVVRIGFELLDEPARPFPRGLHRLSDLPWAPVGRDAWRPWLDGAWAEDPRAAAKAAFQYLWFYTRFAGCDRVDDLDDQAWQVLAYLESRRDLSTGFIGMGTGVDLGWAMRGHRNLALNLLWPLGADEPGIERMIDATLACRRPDGLFHDGGMCANMDAVHLLAEYGRRTGHRRAEAIRSMRRCVAAMFRRLASPDGGFYHELAERDATDPADIHTTNGLAFALFTLHYWQALDADARANLDQALALAGVDSVRHRGRQ